MLKRTFVAMLMILFVRGTIAEAGWRLNPDGGTTIEAERPIQVVGRDGLEKRKVASQGEVLGGGWGSRTGDFAELFFKTPEALKPATLRVRYAKETPGDAWLDLILDGMPVGRLRCPSTGGDGSEETHYREVSLGVPQLRSKFHRLYLTVAANGATSEPLPETRPAPSKILDLIGGRGDKNSVGHGKNLAVYTGRGTRKRFFFATHELGNVFSAADGETIRWWPDQVLLEGGTFRPGSQTQLFLDHVTFAPGAGPKRERPAPSEKMVIEQRQVCVTKDDAIVSRIWASNQTDREVTHRIEITGDCRKSADWREKPSGERETHRRGERVLMVDRSVFPDALPNGLCMAIGASAKISEFETDQPGAYRLAIDLRLQPGETRSVVTACATARSHDAALANLEAVLAQEDPLAANRAAWNDFYEHQVPQFECSDPRLTELYGFRWFLLRFSTAGGDLGFFKHPVVMEGRQAYQTYCCYSAPFMALDMNWAADPRVGFGHIANMAHAAYEDGRFPWYTSPRTNKVKLNHDSRSGLSLLPHTAWLHFQIHGDKALLAEIYPAMKKNCQWWLADRDPNGDGLFDVAHQLETGQDDLFRWGEENRELRYDAVDATSHAYLNLKAAANMARALGKTEDAERFAKAAQKTRAALNSTLWDAKRNAWFDRHPQTKRLADYLAITTFYPHFAGAAEANQLSVFQQHLLNPREFWLPHPVPALPKNHADFGPTKFWEGPAWPAATSHVVAGFARAAKQHDRELLPQAGELFRRAAGNHLQPRADFFERYDPLTGDGLSLFRDYMHSWWIDLFVRQVAGATLAEDGSVSIDPLPIGLKSLRLSNLPLRGKKLEIRWDAAKGLTVRVDGRLAVTAPKFKPGDDPILVPGLKTGK
ncbi:MAG: trehalase family glycosidase [Planctomycetales bacterium]